MTTTTSPPLGSRAAAPARADSLPPECISVIGHDVTATSVIAIDQVQCWNPTYMTNYPVTVSKLENGTWVVVYRASPGSRRHVAGAGSICLAAASRIPGSVVEAVTALRRPGELVIG